MPQEISATQVRTILRKLPVRHATASAWSNGLKVWQNRFGKVLMEYTSGGYAHIAAQRNEELPLIIKELESHGIKAEYSPISKSYTLTR